MTMGRFRTCPYKRYDNYLEFWGRENDFPGEQMKNEYNPDVHHRRSIRLKNYDYSKKGLYFITICTHGHQCLFGKIDVAYPVGAGSKSALHANCGLGKTPYSFSMDHDKNVYIRSNNRGQV